MASHGVPRPSSARTPRTEQARAKELARIEEYRALVSLVRAKMAEKEYTHTVLALTTKLLTQNPEYYTIWNYRRRILLHNFLPPPDSNPSPTSPKDYLELQSKTHTSPGDHLQQHQSDIHALLTTDLAFLISLLLTHPKAYTLWTHRLWLLQQSLHLLPAHLSHPLWRAELVLCNKLLVKDPRNFHGWGYRRFVADELIKMDSDGGGKEVVEGEFQYANRMVEANLSNFSAWHARALWGVRALEVRGTGTEERLTFFENELSLITRALYTDPYDQSLWFYHTYLLLTTCSPKSAPKTNTIIVLTASQKSHYLSREIASLRDLLAEDVEDCKWVLEALAIYAGMLWRLEGKGKRVDGGVEEGEIEQWLNKLQDIDPLRKGRWRDWGQGVGVLE